MLFKKNKFILITLACFFAFSFVNKNYNIPKLKVGDKAPDISLPNNSNQIISLDSFKGQYVVVDFWASWCVACRKENQNLVRAFHKFKDKKLLNSKTIVFFSVSLDTDKEVWQKAIKNDKLIWANHVSSLKKWGCPSVTNYGISALPAGFLIDPNGIIISNDISGSNIETELEKILFK
ncbi:MAG: TlpA family protein disulfide reductase [Bacteroidia bacterium]|nr:TlpA family protein disulfide reductase [Bacteroidia bacterium]